MQTRTVLAFWLLSLTTLSAACDEHCARLVYVQMYGPDATTRTVVVNALACEEDQADLYVQAGPSEDPATATLVPLPVVKAGTCAQVGHPKVQWGTEFTKAEFGGAAPWTDYVVALGAGDEIVDAMSTKTMQGRRDLAAPLRADEAHGWHPVAWYGGDCGLLPAP